MRAPQDHHHDVLDANTNFIEKPFTFDSLARRVRAIIDLTR